MRAMLNDADLPLQFWDKVIEAETYMGNRLMTRQAIDGKQISP